MADLTCYKLRTPPHGPVGSFDGALTEEALGNVEVRGPVTVDEGTSVKLYFTRSQPHSPGWERVINDAIGEEVPFPKVSSAAAVLVVRRETPDDSHFLAFTFGYGWQLLRPDSFERGFGLKASLNIVFEGDTGTGDWDPARLRSVDAKRVGPNVLRTRHQVAGVAALEQLDMNARRDLLNGVTGVPMVKSTWGSRVTGRDPLQFARRDLGPLGELCDEILASHGRDDYKTRFAFIDNFLAVTDPIVLAQLEQEVLASVQSGDVTAVDMAPPELVDWEVVVGFRYHTDGGKVPTNRRELRLQDYVSSLGSKNLLNALTVEKLKGYVVKAVNDTGTPAAQWSAWRCLFGQLSLNGQTYVLDDGDFYTVSEEYRASIDAAMEAVLECPKFLPKWAALDHEKDYNEKASLVSSDYLLLDRKTISVADQTSPIELCDILTSDGTLIHVKRKKDGSASLSHLFAQGLVSADLLVTRPDFIAAAQKRIQQAEQERAKTSGDPSFVGRFAVLDKDRVGQRDFEVVYAIYGKWDDKGFAGLPFFSKVMLRNVLDDLGRLGCRVSVKQIEPEG